MSIPFSVIEFKPVSVIVCECGGACLVYFCVRSHREIEIIERWKNWFVSYVIHEFNTWLNQFSVWYTELLYYFRSFLFEPVQPLNTLRQQQRRRTTKINFMRIYAAGNGLCNLLCMDLLNWIVFTASVWLYLCAYACLCDCELVFSNFCVHPVSDTRTHWHNMEYYFEVDIDISIVWKFM